MKFGCIGEKLGHSFSLLIHRALNLYEYDLMPLAREELPSFFARGEWDGFNVTIPYKKDVIPYLKELSPEAKLCGAVNIVLKKNGEWLGYNTDFSGMKALLERERISLATDLMRAVLPRLTRLSLILRAKDRSSARTRRTSRLGTT